MKLTVFGTGYVGLVTGTCFAEMGNDVLCIDIDANKVEALQRGEIPIFEPGLEEMVASNAALGRLRFDTEADTGIAHGEVIFIAVGTPSDEDGSADLQYVLQVAKTIGECMNVPKIVVDKSTVPVGTGDKVRAVIQAALDQRGVAIDFDVVSNPEFLKEGAAIADFMKPDRVIIGTSNPASAEKLDELYAPFNRNHDKVMHMDLRSAELTKYAANVMLAARISMMNEFASLAERLGADIDAVRRGIGSDPRIGYNFIYPGAGYGGSCFPKDVKALIHTAEQNDHEPLIMHSVEAVNARQKTVLFKKINEFFDGQLAGRTIALWGLAFKPNTDDMREAPSLTLLRALFAAGASVRAYDPAAMDEAARHFPGEDRLTLCERRDDTLNGADALAILTEWNEFRSPDFAELAQRLSQRLIVDGRNLFDPATPARYGLHYFCIGRPPVVPAAIDD
ncbi:MAG: UDP-glucose/GDP-mannose dehydrogenase family protein [Pseudomonadota bacterium]